MPGLLPMFPMCCSTVLRMLLPAAQLAKTPCMLVLPHTRVLCCRTWNSMQYINSPYRPACGQTEALYPDRTCLVCYLCSHVLYLLAVHANFSVSGVRISSPDSGPVCTYVGPWPFFWARFWGLVYELFFCVFRRVCNVGICLEWICGGRCQVSPAGGWCAWSARPSLGRDLTLHRQLGTKLMRT